MKSVELFAPAQYWRLKKEEPDLLKQIVNKCGPSGWLIDLVPDSILGLDIGEVCDIHDFMFSIGETHEDMLEANDVFKNNLMRWVTGNTKWRWLRRRRLKIAEGYVKAVELWGGPAFWRGKNKPEEVGEVALGVQA